MMQLAISTMNKNPKLLNCTPESVLGCLMTASALGLDPNDVNGLGQAYIIPYGNTATYISGYRGLYKLALNSGEIQSITVEAVFDGDEFEYRMGDDAHITHIPDLNAERSYQNLVCVYCITRLKNGGIQRTVMPKAEIEKRRNVSKARKSGPWSDWPVEMAKKTVIRAAAKTWPLSAEKSRQVDIASAADEQAGGSYGTFFDAPIIPEAPEEPSEAPIDVPVDVEPQEGESPLRKAVCKSCGNVVEVAQDASPEDLGEISCCGKPDYGWEG
jgi:recombination protein RecT